MSNFLWPHGLQHARLPCLSPTPGACSNSCLWSRWCHLTISFSVAPFSSCCQCFLASGSFPVSWVFASDGQSIGASAPASVLPVNIQDWFPLGLTVLISSAVQGTLKSFLQHHIIKHQFFGAQPSLGSNSHIGTCLLKKTIALKKNLKNKGNHKVKSSLFSVDCGCTFKSCRWIATLIWQPGAVLACRPANLLRMVRQKIGKSPCLWWCRWVSKPILELAYFHTFCYLNFLYAKKQLHISLPDF